MDSSRPPEADETFFEFYDAVNKVIENYFFNTLQNENQFCVGSLSPDLKYFRICHQGLLVHKIPHGIPGVDYDER